MMKSIEQLDKALKEGFVRTYKGAHRDWMDKVSGDDIIIDEEFERFVDAVEKDALAMDTKAA